MFGWKPLIADFQNVIMTLLELDRLIYGTSYRRKRSFKYPVYIGKLQRTHASDNSLRSTSPAPRAGAGALSIPWDLSSGEGNVTSMFDFRISARLTAIARPSISSIAYVDKAIDVLEQLGVWYPSLGWDLIPYSWLFDWFANLGTAMDNVAYYGKNPGQLNVDYAWGTAAVKTLVHINPGRDLTANGYTTHVDGPVKCFTIVKDRVQASPFGFGINYTGLNTWQQSILVALGLAKAAG